MLDDDVLPDGTKVKAGGMVTYVPYSMGRMEYNWGPDASSFKPERWLKDGFFQNASPFKFTAFQVKSVAEGCGSSSNPHSMSVLLSIEVTITLKWISVCRLGRGYA